MLRLALFVAVIGVASMFDVYFENNPESLEDIQSETTNNTDAQRGLYFVSQTNTFNAKTFDQKNTGRKLLIKSHDKFTQKYYQQRNYQVLKAEVQTQTTPLILSYHYLVFQDYFFSDPDDKPLNS